MEYNHWYRQVSVVKAYTNRQFLSPKSSKVWFDDLGIYSDGNVYRCNDDYAIWLDITKTKRKKWLLLIVLLFSYSIRT